MEHLNDVSFGFVFLNKYLFSLGRHFRRYFYRIEINSYQINLTFVKTEIKTTQQQQQKTVHKVQCTYRFCCCCCNHELCSFWNDICTKTSTVTSIHLLQTTNRNRSPMIFYVFKLTNIVDSFVKETKKKNKTV